MLSLIRFSQINSTLHSLIDVSIPALKLSLDVQNRAADVIDASSEISNVREEIARFDSMSAITERIGNLWQAVKQLDALITDHTMMAPIERSIARIDLQVGDSIAPWATVSRSIKIPERAQTGRRNGRPLPIEPSRRCSIRCVRPTTPSIRLKPPIRWRPPGAEHLLGQLHELRNDFKDAFRILNEVLATGTSETFRAHREAFVSVLDRMRASAASLKSIAELSSDKMNELAAATQNFATLAVGDAGIFALRNRAMQSGPRAPH